MFLKGKQDNTRPLNNKYDPEGTDVVSSNNYFIWLGPLCGTDNNKGYSLTVLPLWHLMGSFLRLPS